MAASTAFSQNPAAAELSGIVLPLGEIMDTVEHSAIEFCR
jgi:hypothetical protein